MPNEAGENHAAGECEGRQKERLLAATKRRARGFDLGARGDHVTWRALAREVQDRLQVESLREQIEQVRLFDAEPSGGQHLHITR